MLLDDAMPQYDFRERHARVIEAPADAVRRAIDTWRPRNPVARLLFALRRIPAPEGTMREWAASLGFLVLAEDGSEVVLGQIGRFWALNERQALVSPRTVEEFQTFADPRYATTAMNLRTDDLGDGRTRLYTETRVRALGRGARWRFRFYWLLIRPFSGLLRHYMLRGIAGEARDGG
jgi:hypothetical protein